eukprot:gnl/MRDRNA2_/MRDRNA2_205047_c0_seq1.p1 gnl/MRDRNA2_/MRDRNA2_205047_c0~~gnl/MRDRNA2_/MRDRNA2_205047_c0_seq1.p1  ORF type:complete len:406 (+),score=66.35 gnl/MRDRNA2_/MRDRNA2_205047_c0_seq1:191-1408(+)
MLDQSLASDEPLLQDSVGSSSRCNGKIFTLLLVGFGSTALVQCTAWNRMSEPDLPLAIWEPTITTASRMTRINPVSAAVDQCQNHPRDSKHFRLHPVASRVWPNEVKAVDVRVMAGHGAKLETKERTRSQIARKPFEWWHERVWQENRMSQVALSRREVLCATAAVAATVQRGDAKAKIVKGPQLREVTLLASEEPSNAAAALARVFNGAPCEGTSVVPSFGPTLLVARGQGGTAADSMVVSVGIPAAARAKAVGEGREGVISSGRGFRCSGDAFAGCGVAVNMLGGMQVQYAKASGVRKPAAALARLVLSCADVDNTAAFYENLGLSRLVAGKQPGVVSQAAEDPSPEANVVLGFGDGTTALELRKSGMGGGVARLMVSVPAAVAGAPTELQDPDGRLVALAVG